MAQTVHAGRFAFVALINHIFKSVCAFVITIGTQTYLDPAPFTVSAPETRFPMGFT